MKKIDETNIDIAGTLIEEHKLASSKMLRMMML